jgi:hypothetical protein
MVDWALRIGGASIWEGDERALVSSSGCSASAMREVSPNKANGIVAGR